MVLTESWTLRKHWACGRSMAQYKGGYPAGFLQRLDKKIGLKGKRVLTLFCGSSDYGDTLDIKHEVNPTYVADCRGRFMMGKTDFYDRVIADPPYDSQNITYSDKLYKEKVVKPYSFVKEAVRVCKPNGLICILHQLVYKTLEGTERYAVIPITTGPNQRIRVLNIFKKLKQ
ncbi:hypothetical protein LCGC14_1849910 [marine sediment metagenome]|uniref:DNA methylase N-4/N-6 domain-containing protein n=1 Tax=marine sediment metagenome TaxID=412755 RepID=A0A0F9J9Y8_9ZZZZ